MREDLEDRVEALIDTALEAPTASKRVAAARKALKLKPDAVEACVILGLHMTNASERIALLREGARIGAAQWAKEIEQPPKRFFWKEFETRAYMRAVYNLALTLWACGDQIEAVRLADDLIRINPEDNLGCRFLGLAWHPVLGNWERVEALLAEYEEERVEYAYARCLNTFRRRGDTVRDLATALKLNSHVPGLLTGWPSRYDSDAMLVAPGSQEEAANYVEHNRDAWKAVPGAIAWLTDVAQRPRV